MTTPSDNPPELKEKDFIHESYRQDPGTFWFWLSIIIVVVALLWGGRTWYVDWMERQIVASPFLQVTNRDFSIFLWQFPEKMRVNASQKNGYLTGFQYAEKVTMELDATEQYVVAPPELLFLYHTWHRLLYDEYSPRPIPVKDFRIFLAYAQEWLPRYWPNAPADYVKLVEKLDQISLEDLQPLPMTSLPFEVRKAFQGWYNFSKDGELINKVEPTYSQMKEFLTANPHYARNYWRNIVLDTVPKYLQAIFLGKFDPEAKIPQDELSAFLKLAFFNFQQSKKTATVDALTVPAK